MTGNESIALHCEKGRLRKISKSHYHCLLRFSIQGPRPHFLRQEPTIRFYVSVLKVYHSTLRNELELTVVDRHR